MLHGINRSIIEINETGNDHFEKILVFVKPEYHLTSLKQLKGEAIDLLSDFVNPVRSTNRPTYYKKTKPIKTKLIATMIMFLGAVGWIILTK